MRNNRASLLLMVGLLVAVAGISAAFDGPWPPLQQGAQQAPPPQSADKKTEQSTDKAADKDTVKTPPADPSKEADKESPADKAATAAEKAAADQMNNEKSGEGKATERFTPSQRTSADNSASFPVDI